MESIKVSTLKFKKVPVNEASNFLCNWCGKVGFTYKWWRALVWVSEKLNFKVFLCSDECKGKFIDSEKAQQFIDTTVEKVRQVHGDKEKIWEKK